MKEYAPFLRMMAREGGVVSCLDAASFGGRSRSGAKRAGFVVVRLRVPCGRSFGKFFYVLTPRGRDKLLELDPSKSQSIAS